MCGSAKHIYLQTHLTPPLQTTHTHISILIRIIFRERSVETRSYACFYMRRSNLAFSTHNRMSFGPSYVRSGPFGFPFSNFSTIWQWYILFLLSTCSCCQLVERIIWWNDSYTFTIQLQCVRRRCATWIRATHATRVNWVHGPSKQLPI